MEQGSFRQPQPCTSGAALKNVQNRWSIARRNRAVFLMIFALLVQDHYTQYISITTTTTLLLVSRGAGLAEKYLSEGV